MITVNARVCKFDEIAHFAKQAQKERVIVSDSKDCHWYLVEVIKQGRPQTVGCASLLKLGSVARFRALWIDPRYRGNGWSKPLCDLRLRDALSLGCTKATAFLTDQAHRKWYETNGFQFHAEKKGIVFVSKELK